MLRSLDVSEVIHLNVDADDKVLYQGEMIPLKITSHVRVLAFVPPPHYWFSVLLALCEGNQSPYKEPLLPNFNVFTKLGNG